MNDPPSLQTAGMGALAVCLGCYILVIAADINHESSHLQGVLCLLPPVALQLGCASFRGSFDGVTLGAVCGIMLGTTPMYCCLAWYFSQVWPSDLGVQKSPFFLLQPSYWRPDTHQKPQNMVSPLLTGDAEQGPNAGVPIESVNQEKSGRPTVQVQGLVKSFGDTTVVNGLTFDMYPDQITALLGHNGAGKTTTINMLTGLLPPDATSGDAIIYGSSVLENMDNIRRSMGVCPQHDVLFENLTVEEHILFFSQLKGYSLAQARQEVEDLAPKFHLEERKHHFSHELSGGQRRKLSVAVAISGGSKFIVLDEPTAGMDPLARRELWDLLASLRHGRTMLLTTHYMDEADVLGDRVGIMSLGELQCMGSSQFLKTTFGAGYKLIVEPSEATFSSDGIAALTEFVKGGIAGAVYDLEDSNESQAVFLLPFEAVSAFGPFFTLLEDRLQGLGGKQFGVQITSLEDVFLNVGADHSVTPQDDEEGAAENATAVIGGIGDDRKYESNFLSQVIGICKRKLSYCKNDVVTIPLIFFPFAAIVTAAILSSTEVISEDDDTNAIITVAIYVAAFLAVPGSLAEFIVKEKVDKLRNVLTVMGCTFEAYWLGSFLADYFLLSLTTAIMFVTWFAADMANFYESYYGLSFLFVLLFNAYLIAFSYLCTVMFKTPKTCIIFMPLFILFLLVLPNITITLLILILDNGLGLVSFSGDAIIGALLYGSMALSPHGAMVSGMLAIVASDLSENVSGYPNVATTMSCMLIQTVLYLAIVLKLDQRATCEVERTDIDEKLLNLKDLDEDVLAERAATMSSEAAASPLRIERLRKVFPPKREGQGPVVATQDVCFHVQKGEIFGLLGANGAGMVWNG
jgi:ABC-type multidrug transport system ATPase subunit